MLKSGYQEFKNNRNLVDMEEWREYSDGRVVRKKLHDNGYGVRVKTECGQKMHKQQFEKIIKSMSQEKPSGNVLENFLTDEDGSQLQSLQHYLSLPDQMLEYDYENRVTEDMGLNRVTEVKKGKEMMTEEEYRSKVAKGLAGENDEQIWLRKEDGQHWRQTWYNRVRELPRDTAEAQQVTHAAFQQDGGVENDDWLVDFNMGELLNQNGQKTYQESDKVKQVYSFKWDDKSDFVIKR